MSRGRDGVAGPGDCKAGSNTGNRTSQRRFARAIETGRMLFRFGDMETRGMTGADMLVDGGYNPI